MSKLLLAVLLKGKQFISLVFSKETLNSFLFIRIASILLIFALIAPMFFISEFGKTKAQINLPFKQTAPITAPPEPYITSSGTSPANAFPAFAALGSTISSGYSTMASFISGPVTPEGLGSATPPPAITERFTGFYAPLFVTSGGNPIETKETEPNEVSSTQPLLPTCSHPAFDFDGDCKADIGRWQSNSFQYKVYNSNSSTYTTLNLGTSNSKIAPADFDGDGKFDMAVFSAGAWTVRKSSNNTNWSVTWGTTGDLPAAADYDGDGIADFAIYRPSTNTFWVLKSSSNYASYTSTTLGTTGDIVVPGDFDGDGKADCAVFRPSTGYWYYQPSLGGSVVSYAWGVSTDIPAPGYFDGDGKTDMTVFRPSTGTWYVLKSTGGSPNYTQTTWGNLGDQPVPADYDGDGTTDMAVYRPTTGTWWTLKSSGGSPNYTVLNLGTSSDQPVPSAYLKQSGAELYPDQLSPARLAPINATGGTNYYSRNSSWSTGLVSLSGRSGMNLSIGMGYNSLVWTKVGSVMAFDMDKSNLAPGFNFGFPRIEPAYISSQTSILSYLMVSPSGARTEFRQTAAGDTYETADSSYAQVKVNNPVSSNNPTPIEEITLTVTGTDGTQMSYAWIGNAYRCTKITDRNGNYITISNNSDGQLTSVTDTLGRVVAVNYDSYARPSSITQNWQTSNGSSSTTTTHTWASFTYTTKTINTSFDSSLYIYGPANNTSISVLDKITYADGSYTKFDYNGYAQVYKVSNYAANSDLLNYIWRNIESPSSNQTDCPRFTQTKTKVANFNFDQYGAAQETVVNNSITANQSYSLPDSISGTATKIEVSMDNDTYSSVSKTYVGSTSWNEGLPIATEEYADEGQGSSRMRWTWTEWTQDDVTKSYIVNPRVIETRVGDTSNKKKTQIEYYLQTGTNVSTYGLVKEVRVYDSNLSTVLKKAVTEYKIDTAYLSRRLIGLPSKVETYGLETTGLNLMSKVTFEYDEGNFSDTALSQNIMPVQHDNTNYTSNFITGRGNPTSTKRWSVDPNDPVQSVTSSVKYNTAGSVVAQISPWTTTTTRQVKISYADKFNDGNDSRNTYAYPTKIIDPADNFSEVKYRFDIGANVWAQSPAPAGQSAGKTTTREFDSLGRLEKDTIVNTGAYTRYEYPNPDNGVQRMIYSTINNADGDNNLQEDEVFTEMWVDGAGRVRKARTENPTTTGGGWTGTLTEYDILGRVKRQSVPTEVNSSYEAAGDDAVRGFLWTHQKYDWKGRVTRIINTDGSDSPTLNDSDQLFSYDGCGCAGGQVTTTQSESIPVPGQTYSARRKQKVYQDILGRTYKTEIFNWDGSTVYTTTVQTFNGRDQITNTRQYSGTTSSGTYQDVTMTYDGHGRMKTRHYPIEDANTYTSWNYNADDSVSDVTDPRGAATSFTYNSRGLVLNIGYTVPTGSNIPDPSDVSFTYDALGSRTQMTDGTGTTDYAYNELSQLVSETKDFTYTLADEPTNHYKIQYAYNLSGGLKSVTDPFGEEFDYTHDKTGRLTKVDGSSFGTGTGATTHYTDGIKYRAWGAVKELTYKTDDNALVKMQYDNRLRTNQYEVDTSVVSSGYMKKSTFTYDAGSRPTEMTDVEHSEFNRTFTYDHVGRLASNTFGTSTVTPYTQTNTYDAFSQLTGRNTTHWGAGNQFTSTFTNGRESTSGILGTTYDAAGNQTNTGSHGDNTYQTREFDAANRVKVFLSNRKLRTGRYNYITSKIRLTQEFDGDGHQLKQTEAVWNNNTTGWIDTKVSYQLWSSVLGSYLSEVTGTGKKKKTKVFAGGAVIAEQIRTQGASTDVDTVEWIHADPVSGSSTRVNKDGTEYYRTEYEPLGNQEVHTAGDQNDYPEPASGYESETKADDPQWKCDTAKAAGIRLPVQCNVAVQQTWDEINISWKKEGNISKLADSPISPISTPNGSASNSILIYAAKATRKDHGDDKDPESQGNKKQRQYAVTVEAEYESLPNVFDSVIAEVGDIVPLPENFTGLLKQTLESGDCNAFIAKLINKAVEIYNRDLEERSKKNNTTFKRYEADATDGLDLLKKVSSQKRFILVENLKVGGVWAAGTVAGSIKTNDAQVKLDAKYDSNIPGYNPTNMWVKSYVNSAIHELVHLAGNGVFDDQMLARAAFELGENKNPVPKEYSSNMKDIIKYSGDWDAVLDKHCGGK
jgi:YD repeat-containing protein